VGQGSAIIRPQQNETANLDRRLVEVPELAVHDIDDERLPTLPSGVGLPRVAAMDLGVSARGSTMPSHIMNPKLAVHMILCDRSCCTRLLESTKGIKNRT